MRVQIPQFLLMRNSLRAERVKKTSSRLLVVRISLGSSEVERTVEAREVVISKFTQGTCFLDTQCYNSMVRVPS